MSIFSEFDLGISSTISRISFLNKQIHHNKKLPNTEISLIDS